MKEYFYGGGVSVGHQWLLSKHWSLEASVGVGYAHWVYDKYRCVNCSPKIKSGHQKLCRSYQSGCFIGLLYSLS